MIKLIVFTADVVLTVMGYKIYILSAVCDLNKQMCGCTGTELHDVSHVTLVKLNVLIINTDIQNIVQFPPSFPPLS